MGSVPIRPGVYPGTSFDAYLALDAWNASAVKNARTPAHLATARDEPSKKQTAQMVLGTALHARLLERTTSVKLIIDGPINPATGKGFGTGTKAYDEFAAAHPGKIILARDDRKSLDLMADKLMAHPRARTLIETPGLAELVLVWDEPAACPGRSGPVLVRMKARVDKLIHGLLAWDLKSTDDASPDAWAWTIKNYGYHIQQDIYRRGLRAHKLPDRFAFMLSENEAPYEPEVYEIDDRPRWPDGPTTLEVARHHVDRALSMIAACESSGLPRPKWPGYPVAPEIRKIGLPYGELRRYQEERDAEGDASP
jgi:exodeoxyribonuclease VIII